MTSLAPAPAHSSKSLPPRLPRSNAPRAGQTLAGYVLNLAFRLGITPSDLMKRTGLASKERTHVLQLAFGMELPRDALAQFAHTTAMTEEEAIGLTMKSLAHLTVIPRISKARDDRQWIDIRTSRYCPHCLADSGPGGSPDELAQPTWHRNWLTPWAIACTAHEVELLTVCPACGTRIGETSGQLRSLIPHVMQPVTHPAACRAKAANAKYLPLCDTRLDQAIAPSASARHLDLQRTLDQVLTGHDPHHVTSLGMPVTGRQYLLDLRLLMIALQMAADSTAFDPLPAHLRKETQDYVARRAASVGKLVRSNRTVTLPPENHHATVGLLLTAADLLSRPANEGRINHLATTATQAEVNNWRSAQAGGEPSSALWGALTSQRLHTTSPTKLHAHTAGSAFTFRPEHIPAFLPADLLVKHFPDVQPRHERRLRRYVPIALARLVGDFPTAREAGEFLGYSTFAIQDATGRQSGVFPDQGIAEIRKRVADVAFDLEAASRIDYATPRTQIDRDWIIPNDTWAELRSRLTDGGLSRSNVNWDKRRRLYTLWFWAALTGGDINLAPMVREEREQRLQSKGTVAQLRDLQRKSSARHNRIIEDVATTLRPTF